MQAIRDAQFRDDEKKLISLEGFYVITGYFIPLQEHLVQNMTADGRYINPTRWKWKRLSVDKNFLQTVENYSGTQHQVTINVKGIETDSDNDPDMLHELQCIDPKYFIPIMGKIGKSSTAISISQLFFGQ